MLSLGLAGDRFTPRSFSEVVRVVYSEPKDSEVQAPLIVFLMGIGELGRLSYSHLREQAEPKN